MNCPTKYQAITGNIDHRSFIQGFTTGERDLEG